MKYKVGADLALERMWNDGHKEKHWYFSVPKYILKEGFDDYLRHTKWVMECDGKMIDKPFNSDNMSTIGSYEIEKDWCEYR